MKKWILGIGCLWVAVVTWGDGDALYKQALVAYQENAEQACALFVQAAEEGNVSAMAGAGHCYEKGTGTSVDYTKAIEWYEKAVAQNSLKACEGLARIFASCPDPAFHDGKKAVRFATAVAKKRKKNPNALLMLAAAHARAFEFEKAMVTAGNAEFVAKLPSMKASAQRAITRYERGEPFPEIATEEWLVKGSEVGSRWALEHLAQTMGDSLDARYNPASTRKICEGGISVGILSLHVILGNMYLDSGDLDGALASFRAAEAKRAFLDKEQLERWPRWAEQANAGYIDLPLKFVVAEAEEVSISRTHEVVEITSNGGQSYTCTVVDGVVRDFKESDRLKRIAESSRTGQRYFGCEEHTNYRKSCENCCEITSTPGSSIRRAKPLAFAFLTRVAAKKGHEESQQAVERVEKDRTDALAMLLNEDKTLEDERMAALYSAALTCVENGHYPYNLNLANELCGEMYRWQPSGRTAYLVGLLCLSIGEKSYYIQSSDFSRRGMDWLECARILGYEPAIRQLALVYACGVEDKTGESSALALELAGQWMKLAPVDDPDALWLMACAHARGGDWNRAVDLMQNAIDECTQQGSKIPKAYPLSLKRFKKKRTHSEAVQVPAHY